MGRKIIKIIKIIKKGKNQNFSWKTALWHSLRSWHFDLVSLGLRGCFWVTAFEDSEKQKQEWIRFAHRAIFARFARSRCI